jgi:phosphoglycolate phosphatase-like HAD superfamily hydrolase
MHVVFDLDQTLIRGEAADWAHWLAAIEFALGVPVPVDQDWTNYPVHTDHGLFAEIALRFLGRPHTPAERDGFEREWINRAQGIAHVYTPVDGARELLASLPRAAIATGNIHRVTLLKLEHARLPAVPCACSEDAPDRASLVARALSSIGWQQGLPAVSFGDGVWDVRAAGVLQIGFIGVAQSDEHESRLRAAGAAEVLRDFVDRERVLRAIRCAQAPPGAA